MFWKLFNHSPPTPSSHYLSVCFAAPLFLISSFQMQFMLLFSRQGKLRLQKWYVPLSDKEKKKITRELVQTVLARKPKMCSFLEWRDLKVVYKRWVEMRLVHEQNVSWLNARRIDIFTLPRTIQRAVSHGHGSVGGSEESVIKETKASCLHAATTRRSINFASLYPVAVPTDRQAD